MHALRTAITLGLVVAFGSFQTETAGPGRAALRPEEAGATTRRLQKHSLRIASPRTQPGRAREFPDRPQSSNHP